MPIVNTVHKVDYFCPECGSADVTCDASAEWDVENQRWVLRCTYSSMACNDCELDSNSGFNPTPIKVAPLSQGSVEAYELDVANGVVPPGRLPKYENGVMVAKPMVELLKEGHVIDTSEFSDEIPD